MELSDGIATISLIVSGYVFYWTMLRKNYSFKLVRIDGVMTGAGIKFILINGGNTSVVVTALGVVFKHSNRNGWTAPPLTRINGKDPGFKIDPGDSYIFWFDINNAARDSLVNGLNGYRNEERKSYDFPVAVKLEWFDHRAKEFSAEAELREIAFLDEGGTISSPIQKEFDLYKIAS